MVAMVVLLSSTYARAVNAAIDIQFIKVNNEYKKNYVPI